MLGVVACTSTTHVFVADMLEVAARQCASIGLIELSTNLGASRIAPSHVLRAATVRRRVTATTIYAAAASAASTTLELCTQVVAFTFHISETPLE